MEAIRLVGRQWLNGLIWLLVLVGALSVLAAMERYGFGFFRGGWGRWGWQPLTVHDDTIRAYALALIPFWMAAVLHLLRKRTH